VLFYKYPGPGKFRKRGCNIMTERDEWGCDPSVQMMRKVFLRMEKAYMAMLEQSEISFFDGRLGHVREVARDMFERTWPLVSERGMEPVEEGAARLYVYCLARSLGMAGIEVAEESLPHDEDLMSLIREALP
jgi:hypothetical protein